MVDILILGIFISYLWNFKNKDDTDKDKKIRSGLILYTDYGTGNQYISGLFGIGLQPRLNKDGKQTNIYNKEENND